MKEITKRINIVNETAEVTIDARVAAAAIPLSLLRKILPEREEAVRRAQAAGEETELDREGTVVPGPGATITVTASVSLEVSVDIELDDELEADQPEFDGYELARDFTDAFRDRDAARFERLLSQVMPNQALDITCRLRG